MVDRSFVNREIPEDSIRAIMICQAMKCSLCLLSGGCGSILYRSLETTHTIRAYRSISPKRRKVSTASTRRCIGSGSCGRSVLRMPRICFFTVHSLTNIWPALAASVLPSAIRAGTLGCIGSGSCRPEFVEDAANMLRYRSRPHDDLVDNGGVGFAVGHRGQHLCVTTKTKRPARIRAGLRWSLMVRGLVQCEGNRLIRKRIGDQR